MKNDIYSVLWDIKKENVEKLPRNFIVGRVLTYGTVGLIIETIHKYGISAVHEVFSTLKSTAISKKKYLYLKNYLLK